MTMQGATKIREHLINELNSNGFSDIVIEVNTRLQNSYEEKEIEISPRNLLIFFLRESIDVLDSLSNKNFQGLLNHLNKFIDGQDKIQSISVELLNQDMYNLKELPDYTNIVQVLRDILNQINNEN